MPHDLEAEASVMGVMMIDRCAATRVLEVVEDRDFYTEGHQVVFNACRELLIEERGCDLLTVTNKLREEGLLDRVGGAAGLAHMVDCFPDVVNVVDYAKIVRDKAIKRRLLIAWQDVVRRCEADAGTAEELVLDAQDAVYPLAELVGPDAPVPVAETVPVEMERAVELSRGDRESAGISTGWKTLDDLTGGLYAGEVTIVAARTSVGKSSFALDLARRSAERGERVLYLSLEMNVESLTQKLLAAMAKVNSRAFRLSGFHLDEVDDLGSRPVDRLEEANRALQPLDLFLWDVQGVTPLQLRIRCRQMKADSGLDLVIVDYVGKMRTDSSFRDAHEGHAEVSQQLTRLASDLGVSVVACAQLNRDSDRRDSKTGKPAHPLLSQIRGSGRYEEDAHQVILLQRDVVGKDELVKVIVAKSRMGETGVRALRFVLEQSRFEEYSTTN